MILVLSLISIEVMMMRMKLMAVTLVRPISDCVVIWIFSIPTEAKLVKDSISVIKVLSVTKLFTEMIVMIVMMVMMVMIVMMTMIVMV